MGCSHPLGQPFWLIGISGCGLHVTWGAACDAGHEQNTAPLIAVVFVRLPGHHCRQNGSGHFGVGQDVEGDHHLHFAYGQLMKWAEIGHPGIEDVKVDAADIVLQRWQNRISRRGSGSDSSHSPRAMQNGL